MLYKAHFNESVDLGGILSKVIDERSTDPDLFRHKAFKEEMTTIIPLSSRKNTGTNTASNNGTPSNADLTTLVGVTLPNSLKQGDKVKIGDATVTISDQYQIRKNWANRDDAHSTGIDMVTSTGNAMAMNDLKIVDVKVQKVKGMPDGAIINIKNSGTKSAGFYVVAQNSDGTMSQYMHLDPMTRDEMESLKGKNFKRGDVIWGYKTGSGSMSNPHIKYRVYIGNQGKHIDPSEHIRGNY